MSVFFFTTICINLWEEKELINYAYGKELNISNGNQGTHKNTSEAKNKSNAAMGSMGRKNYEHNEGGMVVVQINQSKEKEIENDKEFKESKINSGLTDNEENKNNSGLIDEPNDDNKKEE